MTEREKIAARIRALLAKTVAAGCTEEEAISAAALAAKLLQQYELTLDEVQLRATPFGRHQAQHVDLVGVRLARVGTAIAYLVGSTCWRARPGEPASVSFFGFLHEVEISAYLLEICARAMRNELSRLRRELAFVRPARQELQIRPHLDGMADRLAERIRAMKPPAPTGHGLIVLRAQLVDQALAEAGVRLSPRAALGSRNSDPEYLLGRAAAERVALNSGLTSAATAAGRLGRAR